MYMAGIPLSQKIINVYAKPKPDYVKIMLHPIL